MRFKKNSKEKTILNIALMGTASFFVIAIVEMFYRLLQVVRNDKKDTVDSRLQASVKTTNVVLLKITNSWRRRKMEVNL